MELRVLAAFALVCLGMSACGAADLPSAEPGEAIAAAAGSPASSGSPMLDRVAVQALVTSDLAAYLNVPAADIVVAGAEERTWIEANLGCGGRDSAGDSLPVRGFLFTLQHAGTSFAYHADRAGNWVRCAAQSRRLGPTR